MFSIDVFFKVVKNLGLFGKGLKKKFVNVVENGENASYHRFIFPTFLLAYHGKSFFCLLFCPAKMYQIIKGAVTSRRSGQRSLSISIVQFFSVLE